MPVRPAVLRLLAPAAAGLLALAPAAASAAPAPDITVDFGAAVRPVPRTAFNIDITGYGSGSYVTNDAAVRSMLGGGRYGQARMELRYTRPGDPTSKIVAGGAGADTTHTGAEWISSIKALGAAPVVIVPLDATDAANLVRHFNTGASPQRVERWIVGNEHPDAAAYAAAFNRVHDAMKAVDPAIEVGGPGVASPDMTYLREFLRVSGSRVDFVDFHKYGAGGDVLRCDGELLARTGEWGQDIERARAVVTETVPARADRIEIQVGELNSDWSEHLPPAGCGNVGDGPIQYRNAAIWWSASVFGHIARAGGSGFLYGDKNGALGILYDRPGDQRPAYARNGAGVNERMPVYQGLGFFTGAQGTSLARFGSTLVSSATSLPDVEVYASADPRVIVVVNKGATPRTATVALSQGGTATGHQKDGTTASYALPRPLGPLPVTGGRLTVPLPGPSVTQLVVS
ncbi:hypothetical protein [Actinomadura kijaniata]|uniref:hypothetical protein n=1 Tax=Actinomadura kijaniata TaxID=46161 RepID=UPI000831CFDB|nr:hypothetical protein [Actinomadura kijaniata]